ncbi:MAG: HAMP domain-containing histidine kinase [Candidatus Eremiobacteraeota bacterium]|nr:HAMP domain-containing histidine kinase [Candidatus Eremiobacteraeota bacterium]
MRSVPILVLRLPELERIAWRQGKRAAQRLERRAARAFAQSARQCLRSLDLLAHDPDSDVFVAAIVQTPRAGEAQRTPGLLDCRSALERIAAGMSVATDAAIESGWTVVETLTKPAELAAAICVALERGQRERERYEFFATVGHELRTPLTSIRGYLETLIDGGLDRRTARRFLETARGEALRLGRLVDNMFEFSLLDLSCASLGTTLCDLSETVDAACNVVRPLAAARAITVKGNVTSRALVKIDADACLQALINLLDNAIKYGRPGGCVEITISTEGSFVRVLVDDDGAGIEAAEREKIFGLRVRGSRARRPGTGIGLAIVKMIAERAGGEVSAADSPLGGARFELLLPVRAEFVSSAS